MTLNRTSPGPDYTLQWPRALFIREAKAALRATGTGFNSEVDLLLAEAFVSDQPQRDFAELDQPASVWDTPDTTRRLVMTPFATVHQQFVKDLIAAAPKMPEEIAPRPYFSARHDGDGLAEVVAPRISDAKQAWRTVVRQLMERGYLDRIAPRACVDDDDNDIVDQDQALNWAFAERLGRDRLWLTVPAAWPDDVFFSLVEVVHDLVARPRRRWFHDYSRCGWHYSAFAVDPAQILYRWTVNRLLVTHGIALRLAKSGEDIGRLVHTPADGRDVLVTAATQRVGADGQEVRHAVALFRARDASVEHKRSACQTLARVLESRRQLIKKELLSKDEGALFQIANQFDIRHRGADQQGDYEEPYLDWVFWWYLGTVELTNRLLARETAR